MGEQILAQINYMTLLYLMTDISSSLHTNFCTPQLAFVLHTVAYEYDCHQNVYDA